jgi:hypothetical protein
MRNITQRAAHKPVRVLCDTPALHDICTTTAAGDAAELRHLRAELARTTKELHELKAATAQMVRYLI